MEPSLPFGNNLLADGLTVEAVRIWPWLRQTNWLRHAALLGLPDSYLQDCNPTPLSLAHEALSRLFDFVGITGDTEKDRLSPDHRALLATQWADDFSLYETAVRRFEDTAKSLAESPYDEQAFEDRHLMPRLAQLTPLIHGQ